jgi:hypothetical protein
MNMRRATLAIVVLAFATVAAARTPAPSLASSLTIGQRVRVHSNAEPRFIIGGVSAVDDEFVEQTTIRGTSRVVCLKGGHYGR